MNITFWPITSFIIQKRRRKKGKLIWIGTLPPLRKFNILYSQYLEKYILTQSQCIETYKIEGIPLGSTRTDIRAGIGNLWCMIGLQGGCERDKKGVLYAHMGEGVHSELDAQSGP